MDIVIIAVAGFSTGLTTYLFGFGGGFVVVPFVYQVLSNQFPYDQNIMHIAVATSTAVMVFNAAFATYNNLKKKLIDNNVIFPLIYYIAIGSVLGALLSYQVSDHLIKKLFIVYMLVTIADCIFRKGFFNIKKRSPLSLFAKRFGGILIGSIATLLGVGGSVMTIPLLKRHGYGMAKSVAAANPLTLPIAIIGTFIYAFLSPTVHSQFYHYQGLINISILGVLVIFGALGIILARFLPKIRDDIHSKIYVFLLILVTISIIL